MSLAIFVLALACATCRLTAQEKAGQASAAISIGGEPAVTLQRPEVTGGRKPQFISAIVLPGRGMDVLRIMGYVPGSGVVDLIAGYPLPDAKRWLDKKDDEWGNEVFKMGGAILLPFANRIRGKVSPDGKTITAEVAGKTVILPANWSGNEPGAERHAIHGLMQRSQFQDVASHDGRQESSVSAVLHAGNFNGHWLSDTDVRVKITLSHNAFEMAVTATNVGHEPLPMGIGWHPYFTWPLGNREQVKLHLPSETRAVMNNYDDTFITGERVSVKGTPYDFSASGGRPLGKQYLDDNFSRLEYNAEGQTVSELIDPAAHFGLRLITLSLQIKSIQVYAPPLQNFVAIEPQFNLPDPYNKKWGTTDTGMVLLEPGQSVTWCVRLELFTLAE